MSNENNVVVIYRTRTGKKTVRPSEMLEILRDRPLYAKDLWIMIPGAKVRLPVGELLKGEGEILYLETLLKEAMAVVENRSSVEHGAVKYIHMQQIYRIKVSNEGGFGGTYLQAFVDEDDDTVFIGPTVEARKLENGNWEVLEFPLSQEGLFMCLNEYHRHWCPIGPTDYANACYYFREGMCDDARKIHEDMDKGLTYHGQGYEYPLERLYMSPTERETADLEAGMVTPTYLWISSMIYLLSRVGARVEMPDRFCRPTYGLPVPLAK